MQCNAAKCLYCEYRTITVMRAKHKSRTKLNLLSGAVLWIGPRCKHSDTAHYKLNISIFLNSSQMWWQVCVCRTKAGSVQLRAASIALIWHCVCVTFYCLSLAIACQHYPHSRCKELSTLYTCERTEKLLNRFAKHRAFCFVSFLGKVTLSKCAHLLLYVFPSHFQWRHTQMHTFMFHFLLSSWQSKTKIQQFSYSKL